MQLSVKMAPSQNYMMNPMPMEPVSRTYQYRKIMKPMLERKRRARINKCLDELKDLMTGTLQADGENVSKLEKADILELTVRHLQRLRENNALFVRNSESISMEKFWAGFQHCAVEVSQFLNKYDQSISGDLYKHIANYIPHLASAAANYQRMASAQLPKMATSTATCSATATAPNSTANLYINASNHQSLHNQPLAIRPMPANLLYGPRASQTASAAGLAPSTSSLSPSVSSSSSSSPSNLSIGSACSPVSSSCLPSVEAKPIRQILLSDEMNQSLLASGVAGSSGSAHSSVPPVTDDGLRYHPYGKVIKTESESGGGVWRPW